MKTTETMCYPTSLRYDARVSSADDEQGSRSSPNDAPIQVVLIGRIDMISEGLASLINHEPDLTVVAESPKASSAKALKASADVVIVDADYPTTASASTVSETRRTFPDARVLALSMVGDPANVRFVEASGADSVVPKTLGSSELFQAIRELAQREPTPDLGKGLLDESSVSSPDATQLSAKEERVLYLLALGNTNLEIARLNKVSLRTVETHRARICQKLGLKTRAELVQYARTAGLISDPKHV